MQSAPCCRLSHVLHASNHHPHLHLHPHPYHQYHHHHHHQPRTHTRHHWRGFTTTITITISPTIIRAQVKTLLQTFPVPPPFNIPFLLVQGLLHCMLRAMRFCGLRCLPLIPQAYDPKWGFQPHFQPRFQPRFQPHFQPCSLPLSYLDHPSLSAALSPASPPPLPLSPLLPPPSSTSPISRLWSLVSPR